MEDSEILSLIREFLQSRKLTKSCAALETEIKESSSIRAPSVKTRLESRLSASTSPFLASNATLTIPSVSPISASHLLDVVPEEDDSGSSSSPSPRTLTNPPTGTASAPSPIKDMSKPPPAPMKPPTPPQPIPHPPSQNSISAPVSSVGSVDSSSSTTKSKLSSSYTGPSAIKKFVPELIARARGAANSAGHFRTPVSALSAAAKRPGTRRSRTSSIGEDSRLSPATIAALAAANGGVAEDGTLSLDPEDEYEDEGERTKSLPAQFVTRHSTITISSPKLTVAPQVAQVVQVSSPSTSQLGTPNTDSRSMSVSSSTSTDHLRAQSHDEYSDDDDMGYVRVATKDYEAWGSDLRSQLSVLADDSDEEDGVRHRRGTRTKPLDYLLSDSDGETASGSDDTSDEELDSPIASPKKPRKTTTTPNQLQPFGKKTSRRKNSRADGVFELELDSGSPLSQRQNGQTPDRRTDVDELPGSVKDSLKKYHQSMSSIPVWQPPASIKTTDGVLPDFSVVNVIDQGFQLEYFEMKVVYQKNKTGFEPTHDFPIRLHDIIAGRYEIIQYLGSAAFSRAVQCLDHHTNDMVCVKIIKNNKDYFDQSLDEIKLLKFIRANCKPDEQHVLRMIDYFYYKEHLFIVTELLRENLYEVYKYNRQSGEDLYFSVPRLQKVARQVLCALRYIHSLNLMHCDLKPENILIKSYSRSEVKVIDFGSSCFITDQLSSYVQSRSYRAPEVVLGHTYDARIDIWSLGCILAELWTGRVLFQNESLATLLAKHIGIVGLRNIDREYLKKAPFRDEYFTPTGVLFEKKAASIEYIYPKRTSLRKRLQTDDLLFVDFICSLLRINPKDRPTAVQALHHPWLSVNYD